MRVAVIGAGPMGSLYGAMFAATGNDVFFVDVNSLLVETINERGLTIIRRDGSDDHFRIPAMLDPVGQDPVDLVLFQVKAYATGAAAELAKPIVGPQTVVGTLQNGLGNEETLRHAFPDNPLVVGISVHSATMPAPAEPHHTGEGATYLGPAEERWYEDAERVAAGLRPSDYEIHVEHESDIHNEIYSKWVLSCGTLPVLSMTGLGAEMASREEGVLGLIDDVIREACLLAAAEGHELDVEERITYTRRLLETAGGKASMLQDIEAGRRTEIDAVNGAAVRFADRHGIAAPLNRAMYALVKGKETSMGGKR